MKERAIKYLVVIGIFLTIFFVFGLLGNIIDTIGNYIKEHSIIFTFLVIGGVLLFLKFNDLPQKSSSLKQLNSNADTIKDLLKILKFKIGEQYDEQEFNLQSKGEVKQNSVIYDMYQYEKDDLTQIFNIPITRGVFLLYNADVLCAVYYRFSGNQFEVLFNSINSCLPADNKMMIDPFISQQKATCKIDEITFLELLVKKDGNTGLCLKNKTYSSNAKTSIRK